MIAMATSRMTMMTAILTIIWVVVSKAETASLLSSLLSEPTDCPEAASEQDKLDCFPRYMGHINLSCKGEHYPCGTSSDEQKVLYTRILKTDSYRTDFCCKNYTYSDYNNTTISSNSTVDLEDLLRRVTILESYLCTHCAVISPIL